MHNTHINKKLRDLHGSMLDILGVMNSPQRDKAMVKDAGISLDRALFPLLVMIERHGPIAIIELADHVGRDYTTVSRQVTKLESTGLAQRIDNPHDGRSKLAAITAAGKAMTDKVDAARERIGLEIFQDWADEDIEALVTLTRRLADAMKALPLEAAHNTPQDTE